MNRLQALHLDVASGRRFALWHQPVQPPRRLVVHAHAFAEEMNKSRRMVALQSRALAADGAAVLVPDLGGCGDSDGELVDATWAGWIDDLVAAAGWAGRELAAQGAAAEPLECWMWGHRLGALLAAEAVRALPDRWNLLLWQPVLQGRLAVQQFLRLDGAAALLAKGGVGGRPSAKSMLAAGRPAQVAGYEVAPALMAAIGGARLTPPARPGRMVWLDVASDEGPPPAAQAAIDDWRTAGWDVMRHVVAGPAFWQTTEIEEVPALIEATCRGLSGALAGPAT